MYQIFFDEYTVFDPRLDAYLVREPSVSLAVDEPGSASIVLDAGHPSLPHITKLKGVLEVLEDGVPLYRGRVIKDTVDFHLSHTIETEGLLACLNDSVVAPFTFPDDFVNAENAENVVEYFLGWLLTEHNAQVTEEQQIHLGTVTVEDPNNYISRSSTEYATTWATIQDKLLGSNLGGHILVRYEDAGTYIDYVSDFELTNTDNIEFAHNLLDLSDETDAAEVYSQILPLGAEDLTIADLPDGPITSDLTKTGAIITSARAVAAYGKITRVQKWDDVTEAQNLQSKAAAELAGAGEAQTITVQACDLRLEGRTLRVGRNTLLASDPHNFAALFPLMQLDIDILDPAQTSATFSRKSVSQTSLMQQQTRRASERADQQQQQLDHQERDLAALVQSTTEQITSAVQTSEAFIFEALEQYVQTGDFETYRQQVSTQLEQTAQQIQLTFTTVTDQIQTVDADVQRKYNERTRYIRFVDGSIILGQQGDPLMLTIQRDRMAFQLNGLEVAYFQHNRLYVTDAEFLTSVTIGNFAFTPGAAGNLSFRKVK